MHFLYDSYFPFALCRWVVDNENYSVRRPQTKYMYRLFKYYKSLSSGTLIGAGMIFKTPKIWRKSIFFQNGQKGRKGYRFLSFPQFLAKNGENRGEDNIAPPPRQNARQKSPGRIGLSYYNFTAQPNN